MMTSEARAFTRLKMIFIIRKLAVDKINGEIISLHPISGYKNYDVISIEF